MKLWLKYTIAGLIGILLGLVLQTDTLLYSLILGIAEFVLRLGRFILFPLFFFTMAVSVCQLRRDRVLLKTSGKLIIFSLSAVIIQILLSTGITFILPIDRIPIITETSGWQSPYPFRNMTGISSIPEVLRSIIPINSFAIFTYAGDFILPALLFSLFLGTQLVHDKEEAEPVFNLFDSFSRILYKMNALFSEIFTAFLIPVTTIMVIHIRSITDFASYFGLIRIIAIATTVILFGFYPLVYFLVSRRRPYSDMRVFLSTIIASLFTGDNFINSQILLRTMKENGGIKRKITGYSIPLLTMFSRAGTAMVTCVSLLTILKSYSSLELTAFQIFWVMGASVLISTLLFAQSYMGVYTALIISCSLYGRGLLEGYVLILPILPVLTIFAGILDNANTAFITMALGNEDNYRFPEDPEDYV